MDSNLRKLGFKNGFFNEGLESARVHVRAYAFVCTCAWARACTLMCSRTSLLIDIFPSIYSTGIIECGSDGLRLEI